MTPNEIAAHNLGVAAVADLAARSAASMRAKEIEKPTRYPFAAEALQAIADAAADLLLTSENAPMLGSTLGKDASDLQKGVIS